MSKTSVHHAPTAFAPGKPEIANKEFLFKQKIVWNMLQRVYQPEFATDLFNLGKSYNMEKNLESYKRPEFVRDFMTMYKHDMLPRGEIFSVFESKHLNQAIALFKVFYHSKDFDTFHKTAAWARIYVNEGLFHYAFCVAVTHFHETQHIKLPPQSESYPYLYHNSDVLRKAEFARIRKDRTVGSVDGVTIVNGSYSDCSWGDEVPLSYYTEDTTAGDTQYYVHIAHPFWMSTEEYNLPSDIRGLGYLGNWRWGYARFYMERLCNGMGEVEDFNWNRGMPYSYLPSWSYHNGIWPRSREAGSLIPNYKYEELTEVQNWENRISTAIDTGYYLDRNGSLVPFVDEEGVNILGNMIEGNMDSVNLGAYGSFDRSCRNVLGFTPKSQNKYKVVPSVLEHYGTAPRDPMFWSMARKIVRWHEQFTGKLPKYTKEELEFSGVEVSAVHVDRVTTFFAPYDALITEAFLGDNIGDKTVIKARQNRLDHKPFGITVTVKSAKEVDARVQLFLGPTCDKDGHKVDIVDNWKYFIPIDEWTEHLKAGTNTIQRNSTQSLMGVTDKPTGDVFYQQIQKAYSGDETFGVAKYPYGFPRRMLIPKGSPEGYPFQFMVFISPCDVKNMYHSKSRVMGEKTLSSKVIGRPLDRPPSHNFTHLPNVYFKEFPIYHIAESDLNATT